MRTELASVAHKGRKVGETEVVIYDSLEELIANEKPEQILNLFNKANKIRLQANERAKHAEGKASKTKLRTVAFNLLTPEEIARYAGNFEALQTFLDSEEMQERVKQAI